MQPTRCSVLILAGLFLCAGGSPLASQSTFPPVTPRYQAIIQLAQNGYPDSARTSIDRIIRGLATTDSSYTEALYTSASIARDPEAARRLFSRIALDFPESAWADKAFYRLAMLDYGLNNVDASIASFRRIFIDYPNSPTIPGAALFGSRAAFQKDDLPLGCDWIRKGLTRVGDDVETRNLLEFNRNRCTVGSGVELGPPLLAESLPPAPPKSSSAVREAPPAKTAPKVATADKYRIQVAAISDKASITRTVNSLKKAGFTVWQLKAGTLTKIQAGPFATRAGANARIAEVQKLIGGKPFVIQTP